MPPTRKPRLEPRTLGVFRFETRGHKLASRSIFARRMLIALAVWLMLAVLSLAIGMAGYGYFEQMSPADAFINAAMILAGMGPVGELHSTAGKIFAGCYAIFSGLILIIATGFVLAPMFHRVLHKFHVEQTKQD